MTTKVSDKPDQLDSSGKSRPHFFISYNQADSLWAEWIAWQLEEAGYSVVIRAWDFQKGGNFVLDMQAALETCERTLLVLSPDFLKSKYTAAEWAGAFANDPTGTDKRLLPVKVRECTPKSLLAQITYIDLVGWKMDEATKTKLLEEVKNERYKPLSEPSVPAASDDQTHVTLRAEPVWPPALQLVRAIRRVMDGEGRGRGGTVLGDGEGRCCVDARSNVFRYKMYQCNCVPGIPQKMNSAFSGSVLIGLLGFPCGCFPVYDSL